MFTLYAICQNIKLLHYRYSPQNSRKLSTVRNNNMIWNLVCITRFMIYVLNKPLQWWNISSGMLQEKYNALTSEQLNCLEIQNNYALTNCSVKYYALLKYGKFWNMECVLWLVVGFSNICNWIVEWLYTCMQI